MIKGCDYASVDGNVVDFAAAARDHVGFAIVRGAYTYRGMGAVDTCTGDLDDWRTHGVTTGAYLILDWHHDVVAQVAAFVHAYPHRDPRDLPPWLDLEADSHQAVGLTAAQCLTHAEKAMELMRNHYGIVGVYTSKRVWSDVFGDAPHTTLSASPLWLKVPYPWGARNPAHYESMPTHWDLPAPWTSGPGCWIVQYQGDAIHVPGFSTTVDLNSFVPMPDTELSARAGWARSLGHFAHLADWQRANGLTADGVLGPRSFAKLTGGAP